MSDDFTTALAISQLIHSMEISTAKFPSYILLIGAGGSGKSTLITDFERTLQSPKVVTFKFDNGMVQFGLDRWENHLDKYANTKECIKDYLLKWFNRVTASNVGKSLTICDVNVDPDLLLDIISCTQIKNYKIVLVQPPEEVRIARLTNDKSRISMPAAALEQQFDSQFPDYLVNRSKELELPRILNEDKLRSIEQLLEIAVKLIEEAL
jgi:2-phosphoglycerate kinase